MCQPAWARNAAPQVTLMPLHRQRSPWVPLSPMATGGPCPTSCPHPPAAKHQALQKVPLSTLAGPRGQMAPGSKPDSHQLSTALCLLHLEIGAALSEISWQLLPQSQSLVPAQSPHPGLGERGACSPGRPWPIPSEGQERGVPAAPQGSTGTGASPEPAAAHWNTAVEELQQWQGGTFLPFPFTLKQCQTRLKAAKNSRRNQNKLESLFPIGNLPRSHLPSALRNSSAGEE